MKVYKAPTIRRVRDRTAYIHQWERFILYGSTEKHKREAILNLPVLNIKE